MSFKEILVTIDACDDARDWVGDRTAEQAWAECPRGDWMLWLLSRLKPGQELHRPLVRCSVEFARQIPSSDQRVIDCLALVDLWIADGEIIPSQLQEDAAAAWAAAAAAAWAAAAAAAADAAWAADAAADIARKHIPWEMVAPLIERASQTMMSRSRR
jgi:hypothetical protein